MSQQRSVSVDDVYIDLGAVGVDAIESMVKRGFVEYVEGPNGEPRVCLTEQGMVIAECLKAADNPQSVM